MPTPARPELIRAAIRVSLLSVAWALVVGVAAVASGLAAHALALVGFGLDAVVDGSASAVLVWRFRVEHREPERAERVEHLAHRAVAMTLIAIAGYLVIGAITSLVTRSVPRSTAIGTGLAVASVLVLPVLAAWKVRLAGQLESGALRTDGVLSAAGALLGSFALLATALHHLFGWWWSDAAAALLIAVALVREAVHSLWLDPR
ncbi:MAG: cation transporter [Acidimicrobiales bacterium]|nr:cation transporter [Acidimicrobiales bacterium]